MFVLNILGGILNKQGRLFDERHKVNCFSFFDSIMRCPMG